MPETETAPLTKKQLAAKKAWVTINANRAAGVPPKSAQKPRKNLQAEEFQNAFNRWMMKPEERQALDEAKAAEKALDHIAATFTDVGVIENGVVTVTSIDEPKKRGRKKKSDAPVQVDGPAPEAPEVTPEPAPIAEPPNAVSILDAILQEAQQQVENPPPKKRGRPKKAA